MLGLWNRILSLTCVFVAAAEVAVAVALPVIFPEEVACPPLSTVSDSLVVVAVEDVFPAAMSLADTVIVIDPLTTVSAGEDERVTVVVASWYVTLVGMASAATAEPLALDEEAVVSVVVVLSAACTLQASQSAGRIRAKRMVGGCECRDETLHQAPKCLCFFLFRLSMLSEAATGM